MFWQLSLGNVALDVGMDNKLGSMTQRDTQAMMTTASLFEIPLTRVMNHH